MKYSKYPKAYNFKRIDSESISESILYNSLSFLLDGVQKIETYPIQSIVSFWTGVELYIKSILVEEHWSLIVKDTRNINHEDFENGDFVSIDFNHSIELLEKVFSIELEKKTKIAFSRIRKHRNKVIHFCNPRIVDRNAFELSDIFVEMYNIWDELQGLRLPVLDLVDNEIPNLYVKITKTIENHKVILEGKYQQIYENRLKHISNDDIFRCASCNYKSVVLSSINSVLFEAKCLVCNDESYVLKYKCDHCSNLNILHKTKDVCANCQKSLDLISYIIRDATQESRSLIATCHRCGSKSVVKMEYFWFCLNCFSCHTVDICDTCGSAVTHSTKNSHNKGCICCEG